MWRQRLFNLMAEHRDARAMRFAHQLARSVDRAYENDSSNSARNGEYRLLDALGRCGVATVFDVGAFHGEWTVHALGALPAARSHAFEILPSTRSKLVERLGRDARVTVADVGLSDHSGETEVFVDDRYPTTTTLVSGDEGERRMERCHVLSGDEYLRRTGLDRVDVLKIDAEGADLQVLRGFEGALASGSIGLVQFEFTLWAAIARVWLADFYELLEPAGFALGKVFPGSIGWKAYEPRDEQFEHRANYVAVHASRTDMKAALGAS